MLPVKYASRVGAIPDARQVAYTNGAIVVCKVGVPPVSINGWGGSGARAQALASPESTAAKRQVAEWMDDRMGVLIGAQVARACDWRAGASVSPRDVFSGKPIELHIVGIRAPQKDPMADRVVIAHYDYINATLITGPNHDRVFTIVAAAPDPRSAPALAARLEAAFAHDDPPIEASTAAEFQGGMERFGKAQYVLGYVMLAIFLCTVLVLVSVLAHAVTERRAQMALLQVLGFSRATLFGSFVLEALAITAVGAGIGIGLGLLVLHFLPASLGQFFAGFAIPAWTWWGLPIWLVLLLVIALVIPMRTIARLRPVDVRAI